MLYVINVTNKKAIYTMSKRHINLENTTTHVNPHCLNNTAKDEYTDSSKYIRNSYMIYLYLIRPVGLFWCIVDMLLVLSAHFF